MVVEEIPPFYVKRIEYPEKHYINVRNCYYYYSFIQKFCDFMFNENGGDKGIKNKQK